MNSARKSALRSVRGLISELDFLSSKTTGENDFVCPRFLNRFHYIYSPKQKKRNMAHNIKAGVATGDEVQAIFHYAKEKGFALPAENVTGSNTVNAVMETAAKVKAPVIIQFSNGGAHFFAGKGLSNENQQAAILGGISGAKHIHTLAEAYGATVILHTDHCAKNLLPWIDGLLTAGEEHFAQTGKPLYSSHMLDLSEEPIEENIEICKEYLARMSKIGMTLEIELGITGGEEDGVYKPGNVKLTPKILKNSQDFVQQKFGTGHNPVDFVFHGGSGSTLEEIREGELTFIKRLEQAFADLNNINTL